MNIWGDRYYYCWPAPTSYPMRKWDGEWMVNVAGSRVSTYDSLRSTIYEIWNLISSTYRVESGRNRSGSSWWKRKVQPITYHRQSQALSVKHRPWPWRWNSQDHLVAFRKAQTQPRSRQKYRESEAVKMAGRQWITSTWSQKWVICPPRGVLFSLFTDEAHHVVSRLFLGTTTSVYAGRQDIIVQ